MEEIWKEIEGYNGVYRVSNFGNVFSLHIGRLLKPTVLNNGYLTVFLTAIAKQGNRAQLIHRIVATVFIPNPENKPCVNHINGNKQDNNLSNLEWCTHSENMKHAFATGLAGIKAPTKRRVSSLRTNSRTHPRKIIEQYKDGLLINTFPSLYHAQKWTGLDRNSIRYCAQGKQRHAYGFQWKFAA